jgi:uncharacterized membrane protein (DUF373 family)
MSDLLEVDDEADTAVSPRTLSILERLDNLAHVIVAALFILMALSVVLYTCALFVRQVPLIVAAFAPAPEAHADRGAAATSTVETAHTQPTGEGTGRALSDVRFYGNSLELLSSILFAVILLELLRTIITFLKTRDIQAIMQEFLVVGIISSVRKILLVGAQSSLEGAGDKGSDFIKESIGTLLSILGVLLLIVGLIALQRSYGREGAGRKK